MANLYHRQGRFLTIKLVDSDWDCRVEANPAGHFPDGVVINYIQFKLVAGGNIRIREQGVTSPVYILEASDLVGEGRALSLRDVGRCYPAIKFSDMNAGDVIIIAID